MWTKSSDGSVTDSADRVLVFSPERFVSEICEGDNCFICGASPATVRFNDEHVIPDWVLRRYNLFNRTIELPNGVERRYDQYKVPCCWDCNERMGRVIEQDISAATRAGVQGVASFAQQDGALKLFSWLCLLFLKTHLKDRQYRLHLDTRKDGAKIGDMYDWEPLYHAHAIARCFHTGAGVHRNAIGSLLIIEAQSDPALEQYDYGDLYLAQTIFVKLGEVAIVAVLNDSNAALSYFAEQRLLRITGPVSALQLREIMVEFAFLNLHVKNRPEFRTDFDLANERLRIVGFRPELDLTERDLRIRGALLHYAVKDDLPRIRVPGATPQQVEDAIRAGRFTFLFDESGNFVTNSVQRVES